MIAQPLVNAAADFAAIAHAGQFRTLAIGEGYQENYYNHCERVALSVSIHSHCAEVQAAAFLHDTLEDTATTHDSLTNTFGSYVANLVALLTEFPAPAHNRATRQAMKIAKYASLSGHMAKGVHLIKICDMIDNAIGVRDTNPKFWATYRLELLALAEVLHSAPADKVGTLVGICQAG